MFFLLPELGGWPGGIPELGNHTECERCCRWRGTWCTFVGVFQTLGSTGKPRGGSNFHYELRKTRRISLICSFKFHVFTQDLLRPRHYAKAQHTTMPEKDVTFSPQGTYNVLGSQTLNE